MRFELLIFLCIFPCKLIAVNYRRDNGSSYVAVQARYLECKTDEECQYFIEGSICKTTCKCPEQKLLSSDHTKCLSKAKGYGDKCEDNVQCSMTLQSGGICVNNACKCKAGFHYKGKQCWKNLDLNEKCSDSEQCFSAYEYVGLQCESGICKCRDNYYERLNSGCRRLREVGESCNINADCPKGTQCNSMICSDGKAEKKHSDDSPQNISDENVKEASYELGEKCERDEDCKEIKNAVCLDKFCACIPVKYVASENNKQCLQSTRGKVESITKSSCKENAQCAVFGGSSACVNNKCICKNESYWEVEQQFCWSVKRIGDRCRITKDCHPALTNAECKDEKCTCKVGYHQKGTICQLNATKVGDSCAEDKECQFEYSFCNESYACACKKNYYAQNGKCLRGVNSACETDADCCHIKNTKCRGNNPPLWQCLCLNGYTSSEEGNYCLPEVKNGGKCEESFQCKSDLGIFAECREGVCSCKNFTHYSEGKCYISKFPKQPCSRIQDCHPGDDANSVICLKGFCSCNIGYEEDGFGYCQYSSGTGMRPYFYAVLAALFLLL